MMEWIGYLAGFVTTMCYIPQLRKILRTHKASDISLHFYICLFCGLSLWVVYGIMGDSWPIIITNSVSLCFVMLLIVLKINFKRAGRS